VARGDRVLCLEIREHRAGQRVPLEHAAEGLGLGRPRRAGSEANEDRGRDTFARDVGDELVGRASLAKAPPRLVVDEATPRSA
jgi:hypothetical protein